MDQKSDQKAAKNLYCCTCCDFTTDKSTVLYSHVRTHVAEKAVFMCPHCEFTGTRPYHVVVHMKVHAPSWQNESETAPVPQTELTCGALQAPKVESQSNLSRPVQCPEIRNVTAGKDTKEDCAVTKLKRNSKKSPNLNGKTSSCYMKQIMNKSGARSTVDTSSARVQKHAQTRKHETVPPAKMKQDPSHVCPVCEKQFISSSSLKRHVHYHTKKNRKMCNICDFVCANARSMSIHMRNHSKPKSLACCHCTLSFSSLAERRIHMKQIHKNIKKPFACRKCYFSCERQESLRKHMFHSHGIPVGYKQKRGYTHKGRSKKDTQEVKPAVFKCESCSYTTWHRTNYLQHRRIHTGDRPFKCTLCSYSAIQHSSLKIHMRTHTKEKPFQCVHCYSTFTSASNLTKHLRVHTGVKMFKCSLCHRGFSSRFNMERHRNSHDIVHKCEICHKVFMYSSGLKVHLKSHKHREHSMAAKNPETKAARLEKDKNVPRSKQSSRLPKTQGQRKNNVKKCLSRNIAHGEESGDSDDSDQFSKGGSSRTNVFDLFSSLVHQDTDINSVSQNCSQELKDCAQQNEPKSVHKGKLQDNQRGVKNIRNMQITQKHEVNVSHVKKNNSSCVRKGVSQIPVKPLVEKAKKITDDFLHKKSGRKLANTKHQTRPEHEPNHLKYDSKDDDAPVPRIKRRISSDSVNVKELPCNICGMICENKRKLMSHMKLHRELTKYTCSVCNETFPFRTTLKRHMKSAHRSAGSSVMKRSHPGPETKCDSETNVMDIEERIALFDDLLSSLLLPLEKNSHASDIEKNGRHKCDVCCSSAHEPKKGKVENPGSVNNVVDIDIGEVERKSAAETSCMKTLQPFIVS